MSSKIAPNFLINVWGKSCIGKLGLVFAPGIYKPNQPELSRNLAEDLKILQQQHKTQTLVSLIESEEISKLRLIDKPKICQLLKIKHLQFPIKDYGVPENVQKFKQFVKNIVDQEIKKDKVVVAHCKAGLGRTGLFASSCLIYAGFTKQEAILLVRKVRPGAIQSKSQLQFVNSLRF